QSDDYSLDENIQVTCSVHRDNDLVMVKGEVSAQVTVNCARCLEPFDTDVSGTFSLVIQKLSIGVSAPELTEEEEIMQEEHLLYVEHDVVNLDISEYVRDSVILSMPLKPVCREDCKGLCPACGQNLNEEECGCKQKTSDPRWGTLSEILKNNVEKK
ncbi:MAG: DUF177 domain-containing protein, partial [Candidatus Latescibacterota bacterium]